MRFHFTKHAKEKIIKVRQSGFLVTQSSVKETVLKPVKIEDKLDGTHIAMALLNHDHVLRVVYRIEDDIIIIITLYPGRRKAYEI